MVMCSPPADERRTPRSTEAEEEVGHRPLAVFLISLASHTYRSTSGPGANDYRGHPPPPPPQAGVSARLPPLPPSGGRGRGGDKERNESHNHSPHGNPW